MADSTGYLTIGNTDGRLSQGEWSEFCADLFEVVEDLGTGIFGPFHTLPSSPYQSMCIGFSIPSANHVWSEVMRAIEEQTARLCLEYRQDSIAFVEGEPHFYAAAAPPVEPSTPPWDDLVIDPICAERNPGLDEWNGSCCRFPKSCSPYITRDALARRAASTYDDGNDERTER